MKNIFRSKILTKIFPFLTARCTILCPLRLQPTCNDCFIPVQWFSSVFIKHKDLHWQSLAINASLSSFMGGGSRKFLQGISDDFFLVISVFHRGPYEPPSLGKGPIASRWGFIPVLPRKPIATCDFRRGGGLWILP